MKMSAAEELVYAAAFAHCFYYKSNGILAAQEGQRAVQALRETSTGHFKSRTAWEKMLHDFRTGGDA